jgi:DNA-binding NarL/FixJ family response regulator
MNIIVVDDNEIFREGLKYYLHNVLNHKVIAMAENGVEFMKLDASKADIILMDIEMPKLNGVETVKKALWQNYLLKFIAITNYTNKAYLRQLIGAGFKACVFKINIFEEIAPAISSVMDNHLHFPKDILLDKDS